MGGVDPALAGLRPVALLELLGDEAVGSGQPLVYWNFSPGAITGWAPTTPGPLTSFTAPVPSVMFQ